MSSGVPPRPSGDTTRSSARRRIRVISRHSTQEIADAHRAHLERQQKQSIASEGDPATNAARAELRSDGLSATDDLTTRHERFRRLKWAVGVFV